MNRKARQVLIHVTGCIAFLSLPVLLSPDVAWDFHFVRFRPFQEDFISYALLLLFFYIHYFILIPRCYFRHRLLSYFALVILSYAFIAIVPHLLVPGNHGPLAAGGRHGFGFPGADFRQLSPPVDQHHSVPGDHFEDSMHQTAVRPFRERGGPLPFSRLPHFEYFFQFVMVLLLSAMLRINSRLRQAEKQKVGAELSYLKAQINPHFLFNTLNSIYAAAIEENADNTASAVVKLSGMMRYVIRESHHEFVPLEQEINYIGDYIDLQRMRLGNTVLLDYQLDGNAQGLTIAPMLLIAFIENAFKHGVNPEQKSSISIRINISERALQLFVKNRIVTTNGGDGFSSNIGMENTKNRLELLYPSRHRLEVNDDGNEFMVQLKIDLA